MQLPGRELFLEGLIDTLLTLNAVLPDELGTDHERLEMLAVAIECKVLAGHAGKNKLFDLFGVHGSGSQFPAPLQQVQRQQGDRGEAGGDNRQAAFWRHVGDAEKTVTEAVDHVKDGIVMRHALPE